MVSWSLHSLLVRVKRSFEHKDKKSVLVSLITRRWRC